MQIINERLDLEMMPYINSEGMLHIPYLDYLDSQPVDSTVNASSVMLPNVSRRDSMSINTNNSKINSSYQSNIDLKNDYSKYQR